MHNSSRRYLIMAVNVVDNYWVNESTVNAGGYRPHSSYHSCLSSHKMPRSSEKDCTRYGVITTSATKIGSEERFSWQKQTSSTDGMYDLPDQRCHRTVTFGTALRMSEESNSDAVKRRAGPGTYECSTCYDKVSDFKNKQGNRFALAPRESLDLKTPSPGPVYVISNQYWNGAEKGIKIGFNCDTRFNDLLFCLQLTCRHLYPNPSLSEIV